MGAASLCVTVKGSHPAPVDFQGLCFSLVLWQQPQPFLLLFPKLVKQFKLLPSIHWSTELWSRVLLLKTTSTNTTRRLPTTAFYFLCLFFCCLSPSSHIFFSLRTVNGQVCLWFGITEFFPGICPRAARM